MKNNNFIIILLAAFSSILYADIKIQADLFSRYVWRGADYGNSVSLQPQIENDFGSVSIGIWGSVPLTTNTLNTNANECDLFINADLGSFNFTLTDYFFPTYDGTDSLFNINKHIFEIALSTKVGPLELMSAYNFYGEDKNSIYIEFNRQWKNSSLFLGFGNGIYSDSGDFIPMNLGLNVSKDQYHASYIINPDKETSFLVFGVNIK